MEKTKDETIQDVESENNHVAVGQFETRFQFSPEAERRLVRKIDLTILPIMAFAYMMAFLDKQTLNYSALMGLQEDLHLVGTQYSWTSSIFYFGYLIFCYPASLLMVKFPLGKYLAVNFMLWAIILACHAATKNFATFMVTRFFLGCAEASLSPGFTLLTSLWYRTSEQPLRAGIWFCGNSLSLVFGSLIAAGIIHIQDKLASWQWLFIIFGLVTFLFGIVMLLRLPDSPTDAKFLTEEERMIAVERLKENQAGYKNKEIDRGQILEAFKDMQTWLLALMMFAVNIANGGFTTFNGLVLEGFGFNLFHTLLLGIPGGVIVCIFVFISGFTSSRVDHSRCIVMTVMFLISILGSSLVYAGKNIASRYGGLLLMGIYSAAMPVSMAMISSNVGGFTKRATVSAIYFIMYCAGNIVGPQLFFARQAPKYESGFLAIIICLVVCVVISLTLLFYLKWENSRRDTQQASADGAAVEKDPGAITQVGLFDITDRKNPLFRYSY
ncbi:hypothetical protein N7466_002703 [Penicillium verhagenii]|uniref:uncharacterized protein n=1 Tax=Penicillium verhagenii TaxID=1562060 RepID=UPI00254569B7|nr:uncharacterized protein N7466_002703 [Penicillium verhagenii]KAJ5939569.1 hypothetical protein N7466_002703 [Penicillium verhagenii]